ncbi:MAG: proprotein convertase P-domain-containing protein [Ignavibacteria bacterium]|nr:proprotein convertase P-domain-containing protein [Ignavibacteria bacterium]
MNIKKYYFAILLVLLLISDKSFSQYYYNEFASFDGVNDYFSTAINPELNLDTAFTIETWVYVKDTTGYSKTVFSSVNADNNTGYSLLIKGSETYPRNAGRLQFNMNGTSNTVVQSTGTKLTLNSWNHIAITFKDAGGNNLDTMKFYINGAQVLTVNRLFEPLVVSTDSIRAGNCYLPGNYSNGFKGFIDDLRIYKTRHSIQQIANDRGVPVSMDEIANINLLSNSRYSSLTAAWSFNGNGNDNVGFKNNFIPVNGATYAPGKFNPGIYRNQSNYYMKFNGSSWLSAPDSVNTSYDADSACTFEAYLYLDSAVSSSQTILSKGNSYKLGISANKVFFSINSGSKIINSFSNIKFKEWTHIAVTYGSVSGVMNIYLNGLADSSKTFTPGNINVTNDSLYMGRSNTGEFLFGKLDEVRISKYVKSQSTIQRYLYTSIDISSTSQFQQTLNSYGFEGNTLDNITKSKPLLIRGDTYFEWINSIDGAGASSQAPLIRTGISDYGNIGNVVSQKTVSIKNNSTVRDSIYVPSSVAGMLISAVVILSHTYMDDVDISLRSPTGVTVNLSTDNGGTFNDMCTKFSNFTDSSLNDLNAPFSMLVKPQSSFTAFAGINSTGYWRLTVTDDNATNTDSGRVYVWGLNYGPLPGIINNTSTLNYTLSQNYPNPFNPTTKINFSLPKNGIVTLKVYDALGKEVMTLVNEQKNAGCYEVEFNAGNLASGAYFFRMQSGVFSEIKRMMLIK